MVFSILDTPRSEAGDHTRLSAIGDLDFDNDGTILSPTKGSTDLLGQIRGMRADMQTPRARPALGDRRNFPSKNEFTPLLKSAAKNRLARGFGQENALRTPAGLKAGYGMNSPALPSETSIMEEHTGSSLDGANILGTPTAPVVSSSPASTPMAVLSNRGEGPLDHGRNLATLREQEARLEQIDKENFSLKLKIHFMEEALRKNGKEFNEAAIRENTELKVDKVTLQRDLKQYRKSLAQAEKDLEDYKKQLLDYADRVKRRHMSEGMQEEMDQLRKTVSEKDAEVSVLQRKLMSMDNDQEQVQSLQDEIEDLEADLREKETLIEAKDEELADLKGRSSHDKELQKQLDESERLLDEQEDKIENLQDELNSSAAHFEKELKSKDKEIQELQRQVQSSSESHRSIEELDTSLQAVRNQLEKALSDHAAALSVKTRAVEEKEEEIEILQRKLHAADGRDVRAEQLNDEIRALQSALRDKSRLVEDQEATLHELRERSSVADELEKNLLTAERCIKELTNKHNRHLMELQDLRDLHSSPGKGRTQALESAQNEIKALEDQQRLFREHELQLEKTINKLHGDLRAAQGKMDDDQATALEQWDGQRRLLESTRNKAEAKVLDLEATMRQMRKAEGSSSEREQELQKALDEEKQKHESEKDKLQTEVQKLLEKQKEMQNEHEATNINLAAVNQELDSTRTQVLELQESIQDLEDEIEVLQITHDEDVERMKRDMESANHASDKLKRELLVLQADSLTKSNSSPHSTHGSQRALDATIQRLENELAKNQRERQNLEDKVAQLESALAETKAAQDTLRFDMGASSATQLQIQQRLQETQNQLFKANKEKGALQVSLATSNADLESLQLSLTELESAKDAALKTSRDLRSQLQTAQRDAERKLQSQVAAYERDIENLEQDLDDAQGEKAKLIQARDSSATTVTRLKNKITSLEHDLSNLRAGRTDRETSVEERKDLHDMLKDAKLEAEDLSLQIRERDVRIAAAASKETELRTQLARVRNERAAQSNLASSTAAQLSTLQSAHDTLTAQAAALQARQRSVRFPGKSSVAASSLAHDPAPDSTKLTIRHAAELRGLAKQIEYLSARLRREESFRADLAFVKRYFSQQVAMHARCTDADLALVDAMGIATGVVLREQRSPEKKKSLRAAGLMVLASVRMKRAAEGWGGVRRGHEGLLKKLEVVRRGRAGANKPEKV